MVSIEMKPIKNKYFVVSWKVLSFFGYTTKANLMAA